MKRVEIPFNSDEKWCFEAKMKDGRKFMTTRSKKYGEPGDIFEAFGEGFVIVKILPTPLRHVAAVFYKGEGFDTSKEFIQCWNELHPRKTFEKDEAAIKFVHVFHRVR